MWTCHALPWHRAALTALVALLAIPPVGATGDDADDIAAAILRKASSQADAAGKILDAAKAQKHSLALQIRLCEKAYAYGITGPRGYPAAIAALDVLERIVPSRAASWHAKRLETYRLRYYRSPRASKMRNGRLYLALLTERAQAAGKRDNWKDAAKYYRQAYQVARTLRLPEKKAIYDDMRAAAGCEMMQNRIEVLRAALAKNPNDPFSRKQLVLTHLVDLDQPHEAAKYLDDTVDPTLRKYVIMATREASALADADFIALGRWYHTLSTKAPLKHTKVRMLRRSLEHVNRYLEVYTKQDAQRLRAVTLVGAIESELEKLGAPVYKPPALPAGAVLFLTFEKNTLFTRDGRTYLRDESGAKHHGLLMGGAFSPRGDGRAMVFDGKAYVDVGNPPGLQITGNTTVCMWINPANFSARQNPINKAYGGEGTWTLEQNGTMNYWFGTGGGDKDPYRGYLLPALKLKQWTHVAVVRT